MEHLEDTYLSTNDTSATDSAYQEIEVSEEQPDYEKMTGHEFETHLLPQTITSETTTPETIR